MDEKVKAYSYLRISTEAQTVGDGIRRQMEASELYAREHGYDLVKTISDVGVSGFKGKNAKDGALGQFLAAIEDGDVLPESVLIVESLDRLSRDSVFDAFTQFSQILKSRISIVTLVDGQVYTSNSIAQNPAQLFTSLGIMLRANDESITKSNRIGAAWQRKRDSISNLKLTKTAPAWLILNEDRKDFSVRPEASETVRTIFELCLNGMGVYSITRHLNANLEKFQPIKAATRWNDSYIAKILRSPAVHGYFQAHKRVSGKSVPAGDAVPNYYPKIVDEATFHLVQSTMKKRRTSGAGRKGDVFSNLFSSLIKCGNCGGTVLMKNKGKPPKGHKYLRCHNSLINNQCRTPAWRYSEFEVAFYNFVRELDFSEIFSEEGKHAEFRKLSGEREVIKANIAKLEESYATLLGRFEDSSLPEKLVTDLVLRSKNIDSQLEAERSSAKAVEIRITELEERDSAKDQLEFIEKYDFVLDCDDQAEIRRVRQLMHSILLRTVESIHLFNDQFIDPWDAIGQISVKLGEELFSRGFTTPKKIEGYFSKAHGQRAYNHSERYFVVIFNNRDRRYV